ncbi:hypothetical protein SKAU_G00200720 [Synaphobranchus kaupii]|uniref:Zona pellucida sperm-binding protein 4 n=1 Tax=Synaphobranchus kaupii TaxID=118154 RepID=A0A9Q1IY62_SYNKA|nr:hypothetical protein SKAU_G00200720 [Synaphobranchus kaupii]
MERCLVSDFERLPCGDPDIDSAGCEAINCCFDQAQCYYAREVSVQCLRDGQFRVVVTRDTTIPHLRLESVSLLESNDVAPCGPVHTSATFVVFQFPVSTCGTTMMEEEGYVVYENKLSSSYELGIGPLGTITRDSVHELSFLCRYIGSEVVSLVAEVNTVPPPLPVAAPGPLHVELRLANGQCDSKGCSDATVYSSYYAESDYPVTKVLRDPLYVEVRILGRTDPNIVLTLEHCWATSSSIPLSMPQWSLLVDGCPYHADPYLTSLVPVDGSSGLPNPTHYKRFIVKMFTFIDPVSEVPQKETVFIHCSTAVCYPSAGNACEHACGRTRRHAARMARSREASDIVSSQAVIFEPQFTSLARNLSDGDHEVHQSLAYSLLGVAAAVVLTVFALVLAAAWRSRPCHVNSTKLHRQRILQTVTAPPRQKEMKLALLFVLLALASALPAKDGKPEDPDYPTENRSRFAMLDDVRLLANGLLQLGHSLRDFVHKTKGQIKDIFQKLSIFDSSFSQLSEVTNEIREKEEELKKTTTFLQANNQEIKSLSLEISSKMNSILQERTQLQSKVGGLEEKLSGLSKSLPNAQQLGDIAQLKEVIYTQEKSITALLKEVKGQHEQLNYQRNKIKLLEERLNSEAFEATFHKISNSTPEAPDLEYLANNSTNSSIDMNDFPVDCSHVFNRGERNSGVYPIKPNQSEPFYVYCHMTDDGGSTIIQNRQDGSVDFDQTWEKYENGFGNLEEEFWLGLKKIYAIARQGSYILRIELEDWKQGRHSFEYNLTLEGPASHYALHLMQVSGDLPDVMTNYTARFSTKDHNNNEDSSCAQNYTGGWWFNACEGTNLNGRYAPARPRGRTERRRGMYWRPGGGNAYSLKSSKILIRALANDGSFL